LQDEIPQYCKAEIPRNAKWPLQAPAWASYP
jgi:hypothetical protein